MTQETNDTRELSTEEAELTRDIAKAITDNDVMLMDSKIAELAASRQKEMFEALDAKAYILQKNIKAFLSGNNFLGLTEEELPDAMDRLKHVIKMTDEAAHATIDSTEKMRDDLDTIRGLIRDAKQNGVEDMPVFLSAMSDTVKESGSSLNDILLSQSYQDLSGQMIKKVLMLIEDVQDNIIELIVMIGDIKPNIEACRVASVDRLPLSGPSIPGEFNVVGNQGDVDDLFDSLS